MIRGGDVVQQKLLRERLDGKREEWWEEWYSAGMQIDLETRVCLVPRKGA